MPLAPTMCFPAAEFGGLGSKIVRSEFKDTGFGITDSGFGIQNPEIRDWGLRICD